MCCNSPNTHQRDHETEQSILLSANREHCPSWISLLSSPSFVLGPLFSYQKGVSSMSLKTGATNPPCAQSCEGSYLNTDSSMSLATTKG